MSKNNTKVLTSITQKGGTGKSLVTANLGYVLAKMGYRVLEIDSDSQATLSSLCNVLPKEYVKDFEIYGLQDVYEYFIECENEHKTPQFSAVKKAIIRPTYKIINTRKKTGFKEEEFGFDLMPTDINLADYEQLLPRHGSNGGLMLWKIVQNIKENADYDFILIDCPPSLTTLAYNGIAAATDGILCPINLEISTLRGARNLIQAVGNIQELLWEQNILHKGVLGLVKNEYVERFKIQQDFESIVNDFFPIKPFKTAIPKKTSCDVAHRLGLMYSQFDKVAYAAFEKIAKEVIKRLKDTEDMKEPQIVKELGSKAADKLWNNSASIRKKSKKKKK